MIIFEIRELEESDFRCGKYIEFIETLSTLKNVDLTIEQLFDVFKKRRDSGIHTLIAEKLGIIVGTTSIFFEQKFINSGGIVGHIEDVAVHPDAQGSGTGSMLVREAIDLAKQKGCYKVILDCADGVIPFYEKLGFYKWEMAMRKDL